MSAPMTLRQGYSEGTGAAATPSILGLARGLLDPDLHGQRLVAAAVAGAAHRRRAQIVEADRDPHIGVGRAHAIGRIERDPAQIRHVGLGPGMARALIDHAVVAVQVAADIAGWKAGGARAADEDMCHVLANPALE